MRFSIKFSNLLDHLLTTNFYFCGLYIVLSLMVGKSGVYKWLESKAGLSSSLGRYVLRYRLPAAWDFYLTKYKVKGRPLADVPL